MVIRFLLSVETEEAALLHEEATMTIEELLVRYGQNLNAVKHAAAIRWDPGTGWLKCYCIGDV